jgi:hypothetical protein
VTTGQIYWGAVPFVLIQLLMVALVIAFPELVGWGLDSGAGIDPGATPIPVPEAAGDEVFWPDGSDVPD